jgi:hypothetical protein
MPIIYFSVKWWNTLHQGSSVSLTKIAVDGHDDALGHAALALACWMYSHRRGADAGAAASSSNASGTPRVGRAEFDNDSPFFTLRCLRGKEQPMACGTGTVFPSFWPWAAHGLYVWGSFGVMALVMIAEPIIVFSVERVSLHVLRCAPR